MPKSFFLSLADLPIAALAELYRVAGEEKAEADDQALWNDLGDEMNLIAAAAQYRFGLSAWAVALEEAGL